MVNLVKLIQSGKTPQYSLLDVLPQWHITVNINVQVMSRFHCINETTDTTPSWSRITVSWCWRLAVAHHKTSVLTGLGCNLFDLIQDVAASTQLATCDMNEVTAEGRHELYSWVSSAYMCIVWWWSMMFYQYRTRHILSGQPTTCGAWRTYCFLKDRYNWNHCWAALSMSKVRCKCHNKIKWSTVSKAADMSRKPRHHYQQPRECLTTLAGRQFQ